jgi:hypothetical protein
MQIHSRSVQLRVRCSTVFVLSLGSEHGWVLGELAFAQERAVWLYRCQKKVVDGQEP